MVKRVQVNISDKNYDSILNIIKSCEIEQYDGSRGTSISSVTAYFIDLGLKVYLSSKDRNRFDLNGYREEMLRLEFKSHIMLDIILGALSQIEPFASKNIDLFDQQFNTEKTKNIVNKRVGKYFKSNI